MENSSELQELTKDLSKDTKELAKQTFSEEVDEEGIRKVVKAIFLGIYEALKKVVN